MYVYWNYALAIASAPLPPGPRRAPGLPPGIPGFGANNLLRDGFRHLTIIQFHTLFAASS